MHEDAPVLTATKRDRIGSRYSRRTRASGGLPAVVYGHKREPVAVSLDAHETLIHLHKGERVFRLEIEGGDGDFVLVKALQFDHLGTNIIHADLERVSLDERVRVRVPVVLVGKGDCKGLKQAGAILMHPVSELELECAVTNLPEHIDVDIRDLEMGGTIYAKNVVLPKPTMKLLSDPDGVVAHIVGHAGGDESAEAATGAGQTAPVVLTEKKKEA